MNHPEGNKTWETMNAVKQEILRKMDSFPCSVKICCVKFLQRVVQVQTPGMIADPRVCSPAPSLTRVHSFSIRVLSFTSDPIKTKPPWPLSPGIMPCLLSHNLRRRHRVYLIVCSGCSRKRRGSKLPTRLIGIVQMMLIIYQ